MKTNKLRLFLSIAFVLTLTMFSRYGNLKELIRMYGINTIQLVCIIFLVVLPIYYALRGRKPKTWVILLTFSLTVFPVLYLAGIIHDVKKQVLIVYPISIMAAILIFRTELFGSSIPKT